MVFVKKLRKFILVFFDDTLIYRKDFKRLGTSHCSTTKHVCHQWGRCCYCPATIQAVANWTTPSKTTRVKAYQILRKDMLVQLEKLTQLYQPARKHADE
jgi:hypothetical protein